MLSASLTNENKNLIIFYFQIKQKFYKINKKSSINLIDFFQLLSIEFSEFNLYNYEFKKKEFFINYINFSLNLLLSFKFITLFDLFEIFVYYLSNLNPSNLNLLGKKSIKNYRIRKFRKLHLTKRLSFILNKKLSLVNNIQNDTKDQDDFDFFCEILLEYATRKWFFSIGDKQVYIFKLKKKKPILRGKYKAKKNVLFIKKMTKKIVVNSDTLYKDDKYFEALIEFITFFRNDVIKDRVYELPDFTTNSYDETKLTKVEYDYNKLFKMKIFKIFNDLKFKNLKLLDLPFWRNLSLVNCQMDEKLILQQNLNTYLLDFKRFTEIITTSKFYNFFLDIDEYEYIDISYNKIDKFEKNLNFFLNQNKDKKKIYNIIQFKYNKTLLFKPFLGLVSLDKYTKLNFWNGLYKNKYLITKSKNYDYDLLSYLQETSIDDDKLYNKRLIDITFDNCKPLTYNTAYSNIRVAYLSDANILEEDYPRSMHNSKIWAKYFILKKKKLNNLISNN